MPATESSGLRQGWRNTLRHHLRLHQIHPWQRPRRGYLLAGTHGRRREHPAFIARLVISASEDIGLANSNALLLANACFLTLDENRVGLKDASLYETTIYLATSPKSNSAYLAID